MNWMTSAKNRLQRSSKSKSNNNLRMNASSKLPSSRVKNSIVMHNFNATNRREEARPAKSSESNDVWMLNNLSRNRRPKEEVQQHSIPVAERKVGRAMSFDPLQDLDMTPSKRHLDEDIVEEQHIIFYNDGHLCDELGNLFLADSTATATQRTADPVQNDARRRLFSPVSERTPPESQSGQGGSSKNREGGSKMESPNESLSSTDNGDWWHRLITMLAHSTMAEAYLHIVLVEIVPVASAASASSVAVPSASSAGTSALLQVAEGLDPPTAREVLDALYRALSKVGRDQRSSLIVFDAIRMLEIVDKQQSDPYQQHYLNNNTSRANSTASSFRHTTANRAHTNSHSNNIRNLSYIDNSSLKPMMHSQDADGALDLDTLLGNNKPYVNPDTSYAHQKENYYKPNSFSNTNSPSNATHTNPYNSTNKTKDTSTVSKGYETRSEDHELDWNLFDVPTTTATAPTTNNITSTTQHSINPVVTTATNKAYNVSACANPSALNTIQGDKSVGQKRKATVDVGKPGHIFHTHHRASTDDVELRLEDLF